MGTTSRNPSNLMSHPKEEAEVEAEVEEVEAGEEEEVQHKEVDSKELAEGQFTFRGNWQQRGSTRGRGQKYDKSPNVKKGQSETLKLLTLTKTGV